VRVFHAHPSGGLSRLHSSRAPLPRSKGRGLLGGGGGGVPESAEVPAIGSKSCLGATMLDEANGWPCLGGQLTGWS